MKKNDNVVYKENITHFLLSILKIAAHDVDDSKNFDIDYQKRLKFQKSTDIKKYRGCVDLIDDTEYAIHSAFKYQLGDLRNKNKDNGERYIRLYGVLNAVYLQMNAIVGLSNLLNYPNPSKVKSDFETLDIYKLRGIAGAHTSDYMYDKETLTRYPEIYKKTSFRIVYTYLESTGNKIVVLDENNIQFEFNLLKILTEYEKHATDLILKLIHHMISTLIYDKGQRSELLKELNARLPNLINYATVDMNSKYKQRLESRTKKVMKGIKYRNTDLK